MKFTLAAPHSSRPTRFCGHLNFLLLGKVSSASATVSANPDQVSAVAHG